MFSQDDELINEFVRESREHLATIETDLLTIESMGKDFNEELVNKVFRAAHSIKGGSGFFGLDQVKTLAHKTENVLDLIRSRQLAVNAEVINILLEAFDRLRGMVNHPKESQSENIDDLVRALVAMATSYLPAGKKESMDSFHLLEGPAGCGSVSIPTITWEHINQAGQNIYWVEATWIYDLEQVGRTILTLYNDLIEIAEVLEFSIDHEAAGTLDGPVLSSLPIKLILATPLEPAEMEARLGYSFGNHIHLLHTPEENEAEKPDPKPEVSGAAVTATLPLPLLAEPILPPPPPERMDQTRASLIPARPGMETSAIEETLRVNVSLLDTLMNLAGELVLSRNQLRTAVALQHQDTLAKADQRISQITSELQDVIMQTRLQPIDLVFSKFPRVARDLSQALGKELDLEVAGRDVALDKTIIEGLSDPLTHMVRNAIDHGIETVAERRQAGKPARGRVRIEARHEAGQVVIEIADDGKGIDGVKVAQAAIKKGLLAAEKLPTLSEREKQALIFLPGLSTASQVTDVSGRGVGMDVVNNNLSRLGGQVEIHSELGQGSLFRIKLPLTLAIIPALIVDAGNEHFAIPQANIEELLRLRASDAKNRIELVGDTEVLILRDRILPLARLSDHVGTLPTYQDPVTKREEINRRTRLSDRRSRGFAFYESRPEPEEAEPGDTMERLSKDRRQSRASILEIAVVTTGNLSFALVVDEFHDTEEIVVKPLGQRFKRLREYSGATILGDGGIALILDMAGLAGKAGLVSVEASARAKDVAAAAASTRNQLTRSLLLFRNGPDEPCAIQLDLVQRIEMVQSSRIERLGNKRTIQYRGGPLPLVSLADAATVTSIDGQEQLVVLVTTVHGQELGLLGSLPVDIIEAELSLDSTAHRQAGIAGSLIVEDRTTLLVDVNQIVDSLYPEWNTQPPGIRGGSRVARGGTPWIILAEDSDFFRNQIRQFLEEAGFNVLAASDGEEAWQLIEKHHDTVDVLVTDIEMPRLNGYQLVERIRQHPHTARLPVIAVTSLAGDEDAGKGKAAGINDYQIKLDREKLVQSIHTMVAQTKETDQ